MMSAGRRLAGLAAAALDRGLGPRERDRIALLTDHRVAPAARAGAPPTLNVTPASFACQLDGLLRAGAAIAPLSSVLDPAFEDGRRAPTFVLTFDDGYAGVYEVAWPLLRERGVAATVFVASAYVGAAEPFPFDAWGRRHQHEAPASTWRPLSIDECAGMIESGLVDIGSHTHTHGDFRGRPAAFEADLRASMAWLDDHFGPGARPFAFPFGRRHAGHHDDELMARARHAGVTCALTTDGVPVDPRRDPFGWGRFTVYDWDTAATLLARLHGWYHWSHRVQEWIASRPALRAAVRS